MDHRCSRLSPELRGSVPRYHVPAPTIGASASPARTSHAVLSSTHRQDFICSTFRSSAIGAWSRPSRLTLSHAASISASMPTAVPQP